MDGWAYRVNNTGPDGSFFELGSWTFSGPNALDNQTTNATSPIPFPINSFSSNAGPICANDFHTVTITINDTQAPVLSCQDITVTLMPGLCEAAVYFNNIFATDNCDPNPIIAQTGGAASGSFFPIGIHTITFQATDFQGNISTCTFNVTIVEYPFPTSTLVCNDLVQATLQQNGIAIIGADMVLEGGPYGCYDDYTVMVFNENGVQLGNILDCDDIGDYLTVKVTDPETGNSCWGEILVEDKNAPVIDCFDRQVSCATNLNLIPAPAVTDNCATGPTLYQVGLTLIESNPCDDNQVLYRRVWVAHDDYGNSSTCQEIITVVRPTEVDFPNDIAWTCEQYQAFPNITDATPLHPYVGDSKPATSLVIDVNLDPNCNNGADATNINSTNILNGGLGCPGSGLDDADVLGLTGSGTLENINGPYCGYNFTYSDDLVEICNGAPGVFKIIRTWTVIDWCAGEIIIAGVGGEDNVQVIKVADMVAPVITATNLVVHANVPGVHPQPCRSTGAIPSPGVTDNCSGVAEVHILTAVGEVVNGLIPAPGLPIGLHIITIQAYDNCGNVASKDIVLTVIDGIAPTTICDEITDVNLESTGYAEVFAETFDDGSHDNCCLDHFEVRRMDNDACNDGHNDMIFGPSVKFCCEDVVGNPVTVVFRAFDCFGNFNDCMVLVYVNDKIPPVLVSCPASQRITCDWYADNLETQLASLPTAAEKSQFLDQFFGAPTFFDNCGVSPNRTLSLGLDQCLEGNITRSWTAKDAGNNTSLPCNQTIFVDHVSDWAVEFPADITVNCGTTPPDFGEPEIFYETCELVAVSYDDELFTVVPDACYKILRTWTIINWCVVGTNPGNIDQEVTEQPENQLGLPFPQCDVDSDGDCDSRTFRDSWRSGLPANLRRPSAVDATRTTDPDADLDTDPWDGYITYQQSIKVIDTVDPVFAGGCVIPDVCIEDNTCAVNLTLPTPEVDDCSTDVTITAQIKFGGVWVTGFGPWPNVGPGTYEVQYTAIDNCNNQTVCHTSVTVRDCKKPTPYCKTGIIVVLMNATPPMIVVWASDLDDNSFDNCSTDLKFSFSQDTSNTNITYDCASQTLTFFVDVWVTDDAGNQDFCTTQITVQDNAANCADPIFYNLGGLISNEENDGIEEVGVSVSGTSASTSMTDQNGIYQFNNIMPGGDYTVVPAKDTDPLNGVTTFDLVLINKHVLGTTLLDSPYKIIAADANNSGSVTTFDMVEIRKLILFLNADFPNNTSWRFVKKGFVFPNPLNPWQMPFPEILNINNIPGDQLQAGFTGVKIGDVNGSAETSQLLGGNEDRNTVDTLIFELQYQEVKPGETVTVPFIVNDIEAAGFQFTLDFDKQSLDFVEVVDGIASSENFGLGLLDEGAITVSWNRPDGSGERFAGEVFGLVFKAKTGGRLSDMLGISSRFTQMEAYNGDLEEMDILLKFIGQTTAPKFELFQNRPNPFTHNTVIGFQLPEAANATLTFTDISGRTIKVVSGDFVKGYNEVHLKRKECNTNGVLYYRLETKDYIATRKMILMD
ncbi:MAG: HYR domain-containing protein, partial [Bacteroidetes bacterium]|nr:HYR domain-containing protein [Bacteroidota bacterium]